VPLHAAVNADKRVVTIDLKSETGKSAFEKLVVAVDVLLEPYRPGVIECLGFDNRRLREPNPGLIHCALSGYGQTGPLRLRAGHYINYLAMTGFLNVTGTAEKPVMSFPPIADYGSALQAATTILGALIGRGRGDDLLNGGAACYHVYATADGGFISLGAIEEVFWYNFCQALGRDD